MSPTDPGSERGAPNAAAQVITSGQERRLAWWFAGIGAVVPTALFLFLAYLGYAQTTLRGWVELGGVVALLAVSPWVFAVLGGLPDTLELAPSGVTFRTLGYSVSVPWERFETTLKGAPSGRLRVSFRTSDGPAGRFTGFAAVDLRPPLAHPLLVHPRAPRWVGPPALLAKWLPDAPVPKAQ